MSFERLSKVIIGPISSEKAGKLTEQNNQFAFKVLPDSNKHEIAQAIQVLFKVDVEAVRVLNMRPRAKLRGKVKGFTKAWKKAYVSLKKGHDIDYTVFAK